MKSRLGFVFMLLITIVFSCKEKEKPDGITVISIEEVREVMNNEEKMQLVDVRTPEEYREGHLKSAKNINVTEDDFREKAQQLNKDEPVYLYCRSGKRSAKAAEILREMGFSEIYDMEGGFLKWEGNRFEFLN